MRAKTLEGKIKRSYQHSSNLISGRGSARSMFDPVLISEVDAKDWIFLVQSDVAHLFKHLLHNSFLETTKRAIDRSS